MLKAIRTSAILRKRSNTMLKAKDIMTKNVISVTPATEITVVARLLLEKHINGVPVVDGEGNLVGILCQSDLIAQQKKLPLPSFFNLLDTFIPLVSPGKIDREVEKISAVRAEQAMTLDPATVEPQTSLEEIAAIMVNKNLYTIPVVEEGKLVGIIGKEDVLRTIMPGTGNA
jgi:CBS domain-containing protein